MKRVDKIYNHETYKSLMAKIMEDEVDRIYCRHGFDHCLDVARIAYILSMEENIDIPKDIIYATALLHDVGRATAEKGGVDHHVLSGDYARDILGECDFDDAEIELIVSAILAHNTDGKDREGLPYIIYKADTVSRDCYNCKASDTCYWPEDEKAHGIVY